MSWLEIFDPGLRHWLEFKEQQNDKILEVPATGPGPIDVDLESRVVTIRIPHSGTEASHKGEEPDELEDGESEDSGHPE